MHPKEILHNEAPCKALSCPVCGKRSVEEVFVTENLEYSHGGQLLPIRATNVPIDVCHSCGERFIGPNTLKARNRAIRDSVGFLKPREIRGLRGALSRTEFSEITGVGSATLARWERDELLQTRSHDNYLWLLSIRPENLELLKERIKSHGDEVAATVPSEMRGGSAKPRFRSLVQTKAILDVAAEFRLIAVEKE